MASLSVSACYPRQRQQQCLVHLSHGMFLHRSSIGCRLLSTTLASGATGRPLRCPLSSSSLVPVVGWKISLFSRDKAASSVVTVSALPDDLPLTLISSVVLAALLSFGGFRAFVYFRIQYIIAAMLGKYVPRGGCRILDLDIHEGRNLYYYPHDVAEVVAVTDKKNCEVVKNQAIRAGVPVDIKVKAMNSLSLPSNSMDAVVSVYCLCGVKDKEAKTVLREAIRLLKPGKPFIFVENVVAKEEFVRTCQILFQKTLNLFGIQSNPPKDVAKVLEEAQGLEKLEYETVFNFQDPHIVGLAIKEMEVTNNASKTRRNRKSLST